MFSKIFSTFILVLSLQTTSKAYGANQTDTLSPILPGDSLPFQVSIELDDLQLPNGIHSFVSTTYKDKWVFLCGRTNGMHSFNQDNNNFPPSQQNTVVYVVDIKSQTVSSRSLTDVSSGLTQHQIDLLSVTSPQFYTHDHTLYITGGYGVDTESGLFSTKDCLTAINVPKLIDWVEDIDNSSHSPIILSNYIEQIFDPIFQVTGGVMARSGHHDTLLIFGQNFAGYYVPETSGEYTKQVRKFRIHETDGELTVDIKNSEKKREYFRRRDLNIVPVIQGKMGFYEPSYVAFSGVFTLTGGAWTVPVKITPDGSAKMEDPEDPDSFKQGMNNYACANVGLFSGRHSNMYTILFGGISFGYFDNGVFETDSELPFINQVTTIKLNKHGKFSQYLMDAEYPIIISTGSNPGNQLLFGAGATFMSSQKVDTFSNSVVKLDHISHNKPVVIGYIVGGIQSTLPNTNTGSDSAASPYIFKVTLTKVK